MRRVNWLGVKSVFIDLAVGVLVGALFFGFLFLLAEPYMSKENIVYRETEKGVVEEKKTERTVELILVSEKEPALEQPKMVSLGEFKLTAYCPCEKCCGKTDGITATGTKAKEGRTIAADPDVIPYGSVVYINGKEYVVEDCGGSIKGNRIDVYFDNHQDALDFGVQYANVEVDAE